MNRTLLVTLLFVLSVPLGSCASASGTPEVALEALVVDGTSSPLAPVSFLVGCWRGEASSGETVIEERWSPSGGGVMLATTRYLRGRRVVGWEFAHLAPAAADRLALTPYPGGQRSEHPFLHTEIGPGHVMFEAPEHDYPRRISYALTGSGGLRVAIDAGAADPEPRVWTLARVACAPTP